MSADVLYKVYVWIRMNFSISGILFFFFFNAHVLIFRNKVYCLCIDYVTHNRFIQKNKNKSHDTIHTFKNYLL